MVMAILNDLKTVLAIRIVMAGLTFDAGETRIRIVTVGVQ
jgi:hypothetical protein